MRTLTLLPFLLGAFCAPAFGASTKQLLGARSAHHELRVERSVVAADQIAYDVAVVDLDSGKTVVSSQVSGKPGQAVEVTGASGASEIRVRLAYTPSFFSATVNVVDGKTIVDEFRTWWQLEPHDAPPPPPTMATLNAPGAVRVGGAVKAPVVIRRVDPQYTAEALQNHISGIVIVEVIIDKSGRVTNAVVLKPLPFGLDQAAIDAVRQWTFKPGTLDGEPVDVIFNLTVNFRLDKEPS
jgi:TonB family protein